MNSSSPRLATLVDVFYERTSGASGERTYIQFKEKRGEPYRAITYAEFGRQTKAVASALVALGFKRGDTVAIISESRPEWTTLDVATILLGGITVPMFTTLVQKQVEYILKDSDARFVMVSNDFQLGKVLKSLDNCPKLETIILCKPAEIPVPPTVKTILFSELLTHKASDVTLEREARIVKPEDTFTLIYTSGTTGTPKGVMLTHGNIIANIEGALDILPEVRSDDVFLSFLPLCHSFEKLASYLIFYVGASVAFAESIDTVGENMLEIKPTVMTGVPRFFERIYSRLMRAREKMSNRDRSIFDWALKVGVEHGKSYEGGHVSLATKVRFALADKLVLHKIRGRTGGRIRFFVSGAAALPAEVGRAFSGFGLRVLEGYGMTETSPVISVNPYKKVKWGSVGKPIKNIEVKIAEDGEILTRGPHVMKGYYNLPKDTKEVVDNEGWMHTGDIGEFDSEGYLKITDRKKHLFVSSGGKNIAPAPIEALLLESKYIDQVMLIGDKRQYLSAIIVPDFDELKEFIKTKGISLEQDNEVIAQNANILALMEQEIETHLKNVASYERVRRFVLLPQPFTIENAMLTPTLKVRRKEVESRYGELIESLYETRKVQR